MRVKFLFLFSLLASINTFSQIGVDWTTRTSAADNNWSSVTYGNGLFVAVSSTGTGNRVMTSPDGITWTSRTSAADNNWQSVTYGDGLFVAVSSSGTGNRVMTSPDGITWTSRTSAADNSWYSVTYGNGLFVAVSISGDPMTSPDGITWTLRTAARLGFWRSVTYGNGLFVAVAYNGTGNRVMTSPDGITWTSRTSAADNNWSSVTYGNGLFVAVSYSGTGNRVMTSPDGITWTSRTSAADNSWRTVTYGDGLFVAVTNFSTNKVMTSSDGITWTSRTESNGNRWFGICYGNGIFVAVSTNGTGNRVMTSGNFNLTWDGSEDSDWNNENNWDFELVPNENRNAIIANTGTSPIIDENPGTPATCNDITIDASATLTISAGKSLTISGDIVNNGDLILSSDATGTATLLIDGTASGSGTNTVQQYLAGGSRNYYLGSPVSGATGVVFDNGNESKFYHNATEQRYYTLADGDALNVLQGYVYRSADAQTIEFTGTLNNGALSNNSLPRTGTDNAYRGYNLVANPYPSFVDWTLLTKTNLESTMVYRAYNGTNNVFDTYNATGDIGTNNNGGGAVDEFIAPMQAFWVRVDADGNTGEISFDNTMRSHQADGGLEQEHNILRFVITDGTNKDEAIINFDNNADTLVEAYDSRKMYSNIDAQIATVVDGEELVINSLPESEATSVPVKVNINKDGLYTLEATEQLGDLQGTNIYLEDLYTNQIVNFNAGDKYVFDAKTTDSDRFVVHFNVLSVSTNDVAVNESILIFGANKDVVVQGKALQNAQMSIFNLGGQLLKSTTLNGTQNIIPLDLSTGVYLVEVNNQGTVSRAKVVLK